MSIYRCFTSTHSMIKLYQKKKKEEEKEEGCNGIKCVWGARFGRLAKMGPKGAGSHANDGINRQRRFMRL